MRSSLLARLVAALACAFVFTGYVVAQSNWRWVNPLPGGAYKSVTYGNGTYVAVGDNGMIITSTDAATWTIRRPANSGAVLNDVAFAAGRFIAVGQGISTVTLGGALILTSTDGINWTQATFSTAFNSQLFTIVHSGTQWIAAGLMSPPGYATSPDGISWTVRGVNTTDGLIRGAYGNGRFVFTNDQNRVNTSTDGLTWTRSFVVGTADNFNVSFGEIVFSNGAFYVAGREPGFNGSIYTSTDGAAWTPAASPIADSNGGLNLLAAHGGALVAAGNGGLFTSTNGTAWTKRNSGLSSARIGFDNIGGVGGANGLLFTFSSHGAFSTSPATDGATWTRRGSGTTNDLGGLVHDGTRFVATGIGGTVVTSPDGTTWTTLTTDRPTVNFGKLAYSNGRYATVGLNGLFHSANLTTWSAVTAANNQMFGVIYANNRFLAVNNALALGAYLSTDGIAWTRVNPSASGTPQVQGIAGGGGAYVLATGGFGSTPGIFASNDGTTWANRTPATGFTEVPNSLAYGNGRFVLLTDSKVWTSTDGAAWTETAIGRGSMTRVLFAGDKFITRGQPFATYRSSSDGIVWADVEDSMAPNNVIEAMVARDGFIYGVGGGGMILVGETPASPNAPRVAAAPSAQTISPGGTAVFTVGATSAGGAALTYQWRFNGTAIANAIGATLVIRNATAANAGAYACVVTNSFGSATSAAATLTLSPNPNFGRIANLSILTDLTAADPQFTVGTVIGGAGTSGSKALLVRGAGPSLAPLGVATPHTDPKLDVFSGQSVVATNDNWAGDAALASAFTGVGAFSYLNATSRDAAVFNPALAAGGYTVQISGVGSATGTVIAELYDSTPAAAFTATTPRLVNVSVLKNIPSGTVLTAGFVIGGATAKTVLVRVIGPRLAQAPFNIGGAMPDPKLELFSGQSVIAANDNWGGDAQLTAVGNSVGAFAVADAASKDAILLVTLAPGNYTAQATPVAGTAGGTAIVEVYEVP